MIDLCLIHQTAAPFESERSANQLAQGLRGTLRVGLRTLGRGGSWGNVLSAARGLRALRPGIIHAFDAPSLLAAAMGTRALLVYSPPLEQLQTSIRLVRAILDYRQVQVVCPTATMHRQMVERGVPLEHCHLVRPGVDFARLKQRRNPELRARLGFDPEDIVLLAPGESTPAAGHDLAAWAMSILRVANPRYRLLIWGRNSGRAERFARHFQDPGLLTSAEPRLGRRVEFEEILPVADGVLAPARDAVSTLPLAACMAASLPIVASATYCHSELLEDHHTALLVPHPRPRDLARRVLELRDDPGLQWRLADMARVEAFEYFALTRFLDEHRTLYQCLREGRPIDLSPAAPGAGLRFHGRG